MRPRAHSRGSRPRAPLPPEHLPDRRWVLAPSRPRTRPQPAVPGRERTRLLCAGFALAPSLRPQLLEPVRAGVAHLLGASCRLAGARPSRARTRAPCFTQGPTHGCSHRHEPLRATVCTPPAGALGLNILHALPTSEFLANIRNCAGWLGWRRAGGLLGMCWLGLERRFLRHELLL